MGNYYFYNLVRSAWIRAHAEVTEALKEQEGLDYKDAACVLSTSLHMCAENVLDGILRIAPCGFDAPRAFYLWLYQTHNAIMEINYHDNLSFSFVSSSGAY